MSFWSQVIDGEQKQQPAEPDPPAGPRIEQYFAIPAAGQEQNDYVREIQRDLVDRYDGQQLVHQHSRVKLWWKWEVQRLIMRVERAQVDAQQRDQFLVRLNDVYGMTTGRGLPVLAQLMHDMGYDEVGADQDINMDGVGGGRDAAGGNARRAAGGGAGNAGGDNSRPPPPPRAINGVNTDGMTPQQIDAFQRMMEDKDMELAKEKSKAAASGKNERKDGEKERKSKDNDSVVRYIL